MDHVELDRQVLADEIRRVGIVGEDAADFGRGKEHVLRAFALEERGHRACVGQFEFGMPAQQQVGMPRALERAHDRSTGEAGMAGDVDPGAALHGTFHAVMPVIGTAQRRSPRGTVSSPS